MVILNFWGILIRISRKADCMESQYLTRTGLTTFCVSEDIIRSCAAPHRLRRPLHSWGLAGHTVRLLHQKEGEKGDVLGYLGLKAGVKPCLGRHWVAAKWLLFLLKKGGTVIPKANISLTIGVPSQRWRDPIRLWNAGGFISSRSRAPGLGVDRPGRQSCHTTGAPCQAAPWWSDPEGWGGHDGCWRMGFHSDFGKEFPVSFL